MLCFHFRHGALNEEWKLRVPKDDITLDSEVYQDQFSHIPVQEKNLPNQIMKMSCVQISGMILYIQNWEKSQVMKETLQVPLKLKIKTETPVCIKQERKSSLKLEPKSNSLPNGTHKPSYQMEVGDNQSHKVEKTASNEIKKVPPLKIDKIPPLKLNKIPPLKVDKVVLPVNDQKDSSLKTDEVPHINNNNKKNNIQAVSLNKNNQVVSAPKNEIVLSPTPKEAYSFESEKTEEISPELSPKLEKEIDGIYFESKSTEGINFCFKQ
ncbi:hypothetical protein CEXT_678321 [Caerostris extrusa]|uniref:Uncharacterized protein n=1 Tax=Caerostris extrusa TaxID=172846 RepID=A0AAV4VSL4_CAEEX|nr:hypothetical protein CEXT_678321 [Caerostris extrusa]